MLLFLVPIMDEDLPEFAVLRRLNPLVVPVDRFEFLNERLPRPFQILHLVGKLVPTFLIRSHTVILPQRALKDRPYRRFSAAPLQKRLTTKSPALTMTVMMPGFKP